MGGDGACGDETGAPHAVAELRAVGADEALALARTGVSLDISRKRVGELAMLAIQRPSWAAS